MRFLNTVLHPKRRVDRLLDNAFNATVAVSNPAFMLTVFFDLSCLVSPYLFSAFG